MVRWIKGVSLYRNCGAASVGEYNWVIWYVELSWYYKLAPVSSFKADILSISPLLEQNVDRAGATEAIQYNTVKGQMKSVLNNKPGL